ncbi:hypothetical protein Tco_0927942 [Tanacetum coccineum]
MPKTKGLTVISKVALTEAEQTKLATKKSKKDFHMSHASGSGDGVDIQSKVPDKQQQKVTGTNEGAGVRPELQAKIKDLENVVCKMGKSAETLRLLTNEQKSFRDNLHKSGLGYNGPYVLSQAYAKIPKLYRAYELCDKNKQLHVFDSEETLEDVEKSQ